MAELQGQLGELAAKLKKRQRSAIFLFEGSDAAGKGGAIRRLVWALDARQYRIIPIAAPSDEERAHHYLWRFFRQLPRRGRITIYDRSWYGRVLVERVEGFANEESVRRAYKEINEFEHELTRDGIVLVKFWLQISPEEQLRRFQEREREPWKQHKITAEDYRNRQKTHQYEAAAAEMIDRNSTEYAPFTLVEAEDKHYARIKVLETVCERLERALNASLPSRARERGGRFSAWPPFRSSRLSRRRCRSRRLRLRRPARHARTPGGRARLRVAASVDRQVRRLAGQVRRVGSARADGAGADLRLGASAKGSLARSLLRNGETR